MERDKPVESAELGQEPDSALLESLQRQLQVAEMRLANVQHICEAHIQYSRESQRKAIDAEKKAKLLRWKTEQLEAFKNQIEAKRLRDNAIPLVRCEILKTEKLVAEANADPGLLKLPIHTDKRRRLKKNLDKLQELYDRYHRQTLLLEQIEEKNDISEKLRSAANRNDVNTITDLLAKGASVNNVDEAGFSAITHACRKGHVEAVIAMVDHADLDGDSFDNRSLEGTPLILAIKNDHIGVVKVLLEYGVNTEARDRFGRTALLCACVKGSYAVAKLLLDHGSCVDAVDDKGNNCLRLAILRKDGALEKLLLDRGASNTLLTKFC